MKKPDAKSPDRVHGPKQVEPGVKQRSRGRFQPGQSGNPGGRRRGAVNKQTIAALVKQYGSPLEFLLSTMADPNAKMSDRLDAARISVGYCHRRMPEYDPVYAPELEEPPPLTPAQRREAKRNAAAWPLLKPFG